MKKPEEWLPIPGYLGKYCVSDRGNVMSMSFAKSGLPGLLKPAVDRGYLTVELHDGPNRRRYSVHRLVMLTFVGPRPAAREINHLDGNKQNNALVNLEYCTVSENRKHAFRTGLATPRRGENSTNVKLGNEVIQSIRYRVRDGEKQDAIALEFGVAQSTISRIVSGKRWSHIPDAGEVRVVN